MNWLYGGAAGAVLFVCLMFLIAVEDHVPRPDWLRDRWPFGDD